MKIKFFLSLLAVSLIFPLNGDLQSAPASANGLLSADTLMQGAEWITGSIEIPESDSLFYLDHPAPLLRTEFTVSQDIAKAELLITAAGYYETWLNGNRLGDQQLDPAWTDFSKRVYVTVLDVTGSVKKGKNAWGIMLGNGFYNPLPLRMWGGRNIRKDMPVGKPCAIAQLVITFRNGNQQVINTSGTWISRPGPVTRNNVYLGEWVDSSMEVSDWTLAGVKTEGWSAATVVDGPGGKPEVSGFPPIRITRWLDPVAITDHERSGQIVDFGQNLAGIIRIKINAQRGDTIRIRYGELLYPDGSLNPMTTVCGQIKRAGVGGPGAPAVAEQMDVYVASGQGPEYFQPRFTFHGFRYAGITGLRGGISKSDIQAGRMNSDVKESGKIVSSSAYLNQLNQNCQWTFLSNLQSVQSDCPAREKFGYGGDINATADAYIFNYDMQAIYRKIIFDWVDAMNPDGFVDTAPFVGIEYCGISWESAYLFLQEALWIHYGDVALVKEMYGINQEWMQKVARLHPDLVVNEGLSDHESLLKVPVELTGTCHYFQLARIMARFAEVNGDQEGMAGYTELAEKIRLKVIDLFWDTPDVVVPNQQTLLSCLIATGVLDAGDKTVAMERLLQVLKEADYHVSTGIFGTKYLLEALASNGQMEIAYRMVNQSGFPGWKYMIDNGATTVWETWKESDNTFSQNHPMFGSVSEWYYKWLGGIQPDYVNPAKTSVVLKPRPVRDVDFLTVNKDFPSGTLTSHWKWNGENLLYEVTVPRGISVIWVPEMLNQNLVVRQSPENWQLEQNRLSSGLTLSVPGRYSFEIIGLKK
jgi:alpha-L-rhamnosidase